MIRIVRKRWSYVLFAVLLLMMSACTNVMVLGQIETSTPTPLPYVVSGNPEVGRAIFMGELKREGILPCSTCHYVEAHQRILVGPNMAGISKRAQVRVPDISAVDYLEQSIREPEAYMVDGFPIGTMNEKYDSRLSDEDVEDVIAYLMTL